MHAEILSIGTELLMGELVDTNSSYLAAELAKLGIEVRWVTKVGDDPERLYEAISRASKRSDVTLSSGGLGPTSDDLTRETIARVCGEEMAVQEDLLEHLRGQFRGRGTPMPETNVKQATLIPSAGAISNPMGTAPGWWVEPDGSGVIVAMPGPPRELQRMWEHEVAPRLKERNPGIAIATRNLKTFGISEGGLDEMLTPLFESENPSLGIYSKQDGIHLRAIATAPTEKEARAVIEPMEAEIRRIVGDEDGNVIWGVDDETPESRAVSRLKEHGLRLAIADAYTGGVLASRLSEIDGSSEVLTGSIVGSMDSLRSLGFSPSTDGLFGRMGDENLQIAEQMAEFARHQFDTDVGLGIIGFEEGGWYGGFSMKGSASLQEGPLPTPISWRSSGMTLRRLQRTHRERILGRAISHTLILFESYVYGKMRSS